MLFLVSSEAAGVAFTSRLGGSSSGPFAGLNLGLHTSDDPKTVRANRQLVAHALGIESEWACLKQVHGAGIFEVTQAREAEGLQGDALYTDAPGVPLAVMVADCLPVALVSSGSSAVAHAGWRGLCAGVLESAASAVTGSGSPDVTAWIGPSIGPCHFQVGSEVVNQFRRSYPGSPDFWEPDGELFRFDLQAAARWVLLRAGISVDDYVAPCTGCDQRFYSFRRDGETGRQAVVVWR